MAPAWDIEKHPIPVDSDGKFNVTQLEDAEAFGNKYHSTGSNFSENQNVWRKFIFNEDGGASGIALPNLPSYGLGEASFRRPIGPRLTRNETTGDFEPATIEMRVLVINENFRVYLPPGICRPLKDRAGVIFTKDFFELSKNGVPMKAWRPFGDIEFDTPLTANQKKVQNLNFLTLLYDSLGSDNYDLKITVTGTMAKDSCVTGFVDRQTDSPIAIKRKKFIRNAALRKFSTNGTASGSEATTDDTAKANAIAKQIQYADDTEIGHGSLMSISLTRAYPPGTPIAQTAGRVVNFRLDSQKKQGIPIVRKVTHIFGETNVTEINIESPLLRQL